MRPQAAKYSTPEEDPVNIDGRESIKNLSKEKQEKGNKKTVVITKCLVYPCPIFYTDTISESIMIECRDPIHNICIQKMVEEKEEGKVTRPANAHKPQPRSKQIPLRLPYDRTARQPQSFTIGDEKR
jgi:hypothetical protein